MKGKKKNTNGEQVGRSLTPTEESGNQQPTLLFESYRGVFEKMLPYYLAIGMTYEQYWRGDYSMTISYKKADTIRQNRKNEELWLQGMYIYEAICDISPILQAFPKKGAKPLPYPSKPYAISEKENKRREEEKNAKMRKALFDRLKAYVKGGIKNE